MSLILDKLGIYGWRQQEEHKILGSLLTGDPILMVQTLGSAKSALAKALGRALGVPVGVYDAAKSMFEDIIGFPNPGELAKGKFDPVHTTITCWDKQMVIVDEVNRADPEMQSKWLEFIRGRTIMGYETPCKWLIGAMNPIDYEGTQVMDPAYVGRFSMFLYPKQFLDMSESDRKKVIAKVSDDDAPALLHWMNKEKIEGNGATKDTTEYEAVGVEINAIMSQAARLYVQMVHEMDYVNHFLARFAVSLKEETSKATKKDTETTPIILDGRRAGLMFRAIIATRATEVAMANQRGTKLHSFQDTVLDTLKSAIPCGLNETGASSKDQLGAIERTFRNLQSYLDEERDPHRLDLLYELTATRDITRKVEILLTEAEILGSQNKMSGWTRVMRQDGLDISVLALVALQVEAMHNGTLPPNVVDQLGQKLNSNLVIPTIHPLTQVQMPFADRLCAIIDEYEEDQEHMPLRLMAVASVNEWLESTADANERGIPDEAIAQLEREVVQKTKRLERMIKRGANADTASAV
jgi:hypothetical protein